MCPKVEIFQEHSGCFDGVVLYAVPKFWSHQEMWRMQASGLVLENSLFIRPGEMRDSHTRVTWSPGAGAFGHSEPERLRPWTPRDISGEIVERASVRRAEPRQSAGQQLRRLAASLAELQPSQPRREQWEETIADEFLSAERQELVEPLADMAVIAEAANLARASVLLLSVSERDTPAR